MPLTKKGEKILSGMEKEYGAKKGEEVFYASRNKGTISGVDAFNKVADMTSDDWKELRDKLAKFFKEEAQEPEHKEDAESGGFFVYVKGKTKPVAGPFSTRSEAEKAAGGDRNKTVNERAAKTASDSAPKGYAAVRSELAALGVELKWNDEWEEFTVKKKGASGTGYHTDDLQDAVSTGRTMAKKADDVPAKIDAILKRMDAGEFSQGDLVRDKLNKDSGEVLQIEGDKVKVRFRGAGKPEWVKAASITKTGKIK